MRLNGEKIVGKFLKQHFRRNQNKTNLSSPPQIKIQKYLFKLFWIAGSLCQAN